MFTHRSTHFLINLGVQKGGLFPMRRGEPVKALNELADRFA